MKLRHIQKALAVSLIVAAQIAVAQEKKPARGPATRPTTAPATRPAAPADPRTAFTKNVLASLNVALDAYEIDNGAYPTTEQGLKALIQQPQGLRTWHGPY